MRWKIPKKRLWNILRNINITNKGSCDFGCKALLCGKYPQNEIFIGILKLNNHDFREWCYTALFYYAYF